MSRYPSQSMFVSSPKLFKFECMRGLPFKKEDIGVGIDDCMLGSTRDFREAGAQRCYAINKDPKDDAESVRLAKKVASIHPGFSYCDGEVSEILRAKRKEVCRHLIAFFSFPFLF